MNYSWIFPIALGLLLACYGRQWAERLREPLRTVSGLALALLRRPWSLRKKGHRNENLSRLEEVIRSAELTNNGFFRSLQLVHENLESLLQRAENAEQRLRGLIAQAEVEKKDQYLTAALLLSEGKEPQQVAKLVNLSLTQVKLIQELRQVATKGVEAGARTKQERSRSRDRVQKVNHAALREKIAARSDLGKILATGGANGAGS